jgi:hypothetical protein
MTDEEQLRETPATTQVAGFTDGRGIDYDAERVTFGVSGVAVTPDDVRVWDAAGQVVWASGRTRVWFYQSFFGLAVESVFEGVWYRYEESSWEDFQLIAYQDTGTLTVKGTQAEFHGGKWTLVMRRIVRVTRCRQGRDFVNYWTKVEYMDDQTPGTAWFVDGSGLGWGGVISGSVRIFEALDAAVSPDAVGTT